MVKTPTVATKARKLLKTPKTGPKKANELSAAKPSPLRRAKLDSSNDTVAIAAFCTPGRTTRSMARVLSTDMPPPALHFVTPSKRKTVAGARAEEASFVRPMDRKVKPVEKGKNDSDSSTDVVVPKESRKSIRGRPAGKKSTVAASEFTDEDLPSVSILGDETAGRYVRSRKSMRAIEMAAESSEDDLPSVSILGENLMANKRASQSNIENHDESSAEDLPSVSILGAAIKLSGRKNRARKSVKKNKDQIESNERENIVPKKRISQPKKQTDAASQEASSAEEDLPSVSLLGKDLLSSARKSPMAQARKSVGKNMDQVASNKDDLPSVNDIMPKNRISLSKKRKSMQDNGESQDGSSAEELPSVSLLGKDLQSSARKSQKSAGKSNDQVASNEEDLPSVSPLEEDAMPKKRASLTGNKRKSMQKEIDSQESSSAEELHAFSLLGKDLQSTARKNRKSESKVIDQVECHEKDLPLDVATTKETGNEETVETTPMPAIVVSDVTMEADMIIKDMPQTDNTKLQSNRISIVDLTDSPLVTNESVLNRTFTPEKKEKDGTFTEEVDQSPKKSGVNDLTFSPVPLVTTPGLVEKASNMASKQKSATKPVGKKSPRLKRLQGTPMRKPNNQLNWQTPGKMSLAKKTKVIEAAIELHKAKVATPKVFKFGDGNSGEKGFNFEMAAPANAKGVVKPVPKFNDIHQRMFDKTESISQTKDRHDQRAKLLLSGKKPNVAKKQILKPVGARAADNKDARRPLASVNKAARLDGEQRQERRRELFKQGSQRGSKDVSKKEKVKGIRTNRRFELLMKMREAERSN